MGADGGRRDDRHALDRLGRRRGARDRSIAELAPDHPPRAGAVGVTRVSLAATASYLPERWMTAAEVGDAQRHPRAGDRRQVRPARQAHRRRGRARQRPLRARGRGAARGDRHRPGVDRRRHVLRLDVEGLRGLAGRAVDRASDRRDAAPTRSSTTTSRAARRSRCGSRATCCSPRTSCSTMLVVAACRESYLLDYGNERSRFMFNFGDGAVAGLLVKDGGRNELLGCHGITDGSFSLQVKVPVRRQRLAERRLPLPRRRGPGGDEGRARRRSASRTSSRAARARSSAAARRSPTSAISAAST